MSASSSTSGKTRLERRGLPIVALVFASPMFLSADWPAPPPLCWKSLEKLGESAPDHPIDAVVIRARSYLRDENHIHATLHITNLTPQARIADLWFLERHGSAAANVVDERGKTLFELMPVSGGGPYWSECEFIPAGGFLAIDLRIAAYNADRFRGLVESATERGTAVPRLSISFQSRAIEKNDFPAWFRRGEPATLTSTEPIAVEWDVSKP